MPARAARRLAVVAALLLLGACGGDPPVAALGPCTGPVEATVRWLPGAEIAWTPACGVARLVVATPPSVGYGPTWSIRSDSSAIRPPVTFGQLPPGAIETSPASGVLVSGALLVVQLRSADDEVLGSAGLQIP